MLPQSEARDCFRNMEQVPQMPLLPAAGQPVNGEDVFAAEEARTKRAHLSGAWGSAPAGRSAPGRVAQPIRVPAADNTSPEAKRQRGEDSIRVFHITASGAPIVAGHVAAATRRRHSMPRLLSSWLACSWWAPSAAAAAASDPAAASGAAAAGSAHGQHAHSQLEPPQHRRQCSAAAAAQGGAAGRGRRRRAGRPAASGRLPRRHAGPL